MLDHNYTKGFYGLLLLMSFYLGACSSPLSTSPEEDKVLEEVADTWGMITNISKGVSTGTEKGIGKYYEIEITNPALFQPDTDYPSIAGGIAFLLYNGFSEEERASYSSYDIILKDSTGREIQLQVPVAEARLFYEQSKTAKMYMEKLLQREFTFLNEHYIPEKQCGPDSLKIKFESFIERSGQNGKVEIYNAKQEEYELKDGSKINTVSFQGAVQNENKPVYYLIMLDPKEKQNNLLRIGYALE